MTSVGPSGSGLNYLGGNPLGRKVRTLEAEVEELKKAIAELKATGGGGGGAGAQGPPGPAGPAGPMTYIAMPPQGFAAPAPAPGPTDAAPAASS